MTLKKSSSLLQISASVTETAPNTLTSTEIEIPLNPLDNEVFVVTQIDIDPQGADYVNDLTCTVDCTVSTTSRSTVGSLAASNVMEIARRSTYVQTDNAGVAVGVTQYASELPAQGVEGQDYLGIIATPNAYFNIIGNNNVNTKTAQCRIWGYRATATGPVYAALVQSELLG